MIDLAPGGKHYGQAGFVAGLQLRPPYRTLSSGLALVKGKKICLKYVVRETSLDYIPLSVTVDSSTGKVSMSSSPQISRRALLKTCSQSLIAMTCVIAAAPSTSFGSSDAREKLGPGAVGERAVSERRYDRAAVVTTPSGLQYFDLSTGNAEGTDVQNGSTVTIAYTTRLGGLYGIKLDSSYDHGNDLRFVVGSPNVVQGLNEAVLGMKQGGKRRAVFPPSIAYKNPDMQPAVTDFFARRRLLSVLNTNRDASIVMDIEVIRIKQ